MSTPARTRRAAKIDLLSGVMAIGDQYTTQSSFTCANFVGRSGTKSTVTTRPSSYVVVKPSDEVEHVPRHELLRRRRPQGDGQVETNRALHDRGRLLHAGVEARARERPSTVPSPVEYRSIFRWNAGPDAAVEAHRDQGQRAQHRPRRRRRRIACARASIKRPHRLGPAPGPVYDGGHGEHASHSLHRAGGRPRRLCHCGGRPSQDVQRGPRDRGLDALGPVRTDGPAEGGLQHHPSHRQAAQRRPGRERERACRVRQAHPLKRGRRRVQEELHES